MTKKTPEQQADERFPNPSTDDMAILAMVPDGLYEEGRRIGISQAVWATCIREKVEPLEEWKESAIKVMGEWDKVHEALGKPGKLGESMAAASLAEVVRLRALGAEMANSINILIGVRRDVESLLTLNEKTALAAVAAWTAKELGFVPTNTTEG